MSQRHKHVLILALLPLILGGCAVGPDYTAPQVVAPEKWRTATPDDAPVIANTPWWEIFKDANLQELIKVGLTENKDIQITLARLQKARAALGITDSAFHPGVNYNATAYRSRPQAFSGTGAPHGYTLGGSVQWEIDLWGRIRRLSESATAQYFATEENKNAVVLALVSEIASNYFRLRTLDNQLAITRETIATRQSAYEQAKTKLDAGTGNIIDVRQFEAELLSAQAAIADFTRAIAVQENALNLLLGRLPGSIARTFSQTAPASILPQIPSDLPSQLLLRRPDVRAAEQQVRAVNATIGAAVADYFPRISLTGALGFIHPQLGKLLESDNFGRQGGGSIVGPLFNGGATYYSVKQAEASTREAVAAYEQTALNAFREVDDALTTVQTARERLAFLQQQVAALTEARDGIVKKYKEGVLPILPVLDADRNLFSAQLLLADTQAQELESSVRLYKALGGGWRASDLTPLVDATGKVTDGPTAPAAPTVPTAE